MLGLKLSMLVKWTTGLFFQSVTIDTCNITNMDDLYAALPQLTSLTIRHTEIRKLPRITPELSHIFWKDCNLKHLPDDYFSGAWLLGMGFSNNLFTEVPNLKSIQDTITFIDLSNNLIDDTKMLKCHFKALTRLLLSNNLIRSFAMHFAYLWPKMEHVSLINNKIIHFDIPSHYQNIHIYLTANPVSCSSATPWIQNCQPGEHLGLPSLQCPRQVTLIGITCYPGTSTSTKSHSVLIGVDLSLLMAALAVSLNGR